MNNETFAKLFNTPHGQLLYYLDETEDGQPSITIIGAYVRGLRASAVLSGWPDGEEGQLRNFVTIDQEMAEQTAAHLYRMTDEIA